MAGRKNIEIRNGESFQFNAEYKVDGASPENFDTWSGRIVAYDKKEDTKLSLDCSLDSNGAISAQLLDTTSLDADILDYYLYLERPDNAIKVLLYGQLKVVA
jgi:hypothetical protein